MLGAISENVANVKSGRVVRKPAIPLVRPKSSRIKGINGPTDAIEVRKLTETIRIPAIKIA
jgi:hypothetical protein